jgi:hypothetical protein
VIPTEEGNIMNRIYYAHCIKDYDTDKANQNKESLRNMGFQVIDPSIKLYDSKVNKMRKEGKTSAEIMDFFLGVVGNCNHLAFALTDEGKVSAGVGKEIEIMKQKGGTIIQMPNLNSLEVMSIEETRNYIRS